MQLNSSSVNVLSQLSDLIKQLSSTEYTAKLNVLSGSSMGQHIRHIVEFYIALTHAEEEICYDDRKRDLRIEENKYFCLITIDEIISQLEYATIDRAMILKSTHGIDDSTENYIPTSFSREHFYVLEHAVHHMAILKIGVITAFSHVLLSDNFGIAESTVRYNKQLS